VTATEPATATATPAGESPAADATNGFETPEAAFAALQGALREKKWQTAAGCLTPESQELMANGLLLAGGLMAVFGGDQTADITAALEKHGVDAPAPAFNFEAQSPGETPDANSDQPETPPAPQMPEIKDKPGFIADMLTALEKMDPGKSSQKHEQWSAAELKDLAVDGENATASIVIQGDKGEETQEIAFRQSASGWLVHLPEDALKMDAGGPGAGFSATSPDDAAPDAPLTETVLEGGLTSALSLSFEKPFASQFFNSDFPERTLFATLSLTGEPILNAYEYGEFEITSATDDTGAALELVTPVKDQFDKEFGAEFVELNDFFLDKKDTLPIIFALSAPAAEAKSVTIDGSIKFKVRESVVVKDVLKSLDGELHDERLTKLGTFTIKKQSADNGEPDNGLVIEVKAPDGTVEGIKLLDGQGAPLDTASQFGFGGFSEKTFSIDTGKKLPDDTQLRITLGGNESIQVVPLKIEAANLP